MIEAPDFVEAARSHGFEWYAGVPCSYLTPFINYVLQDPTLRYVSMANEGDAVALIAGVALAGSRGAVASSGGTHRRGIAMMQNSGLGNAVSPLTSLTWTFSIPQLLIVTWRGQPGVADEPQHALMGPITPGLLEMMQIPWELFPTDSGSIGAALERASAYMNQHSRPYALLMQKGTVAPHTLRTDLESRWPLARAAVSVETRSPQLSVRPSREDALRAVLRATNPKSTAILATTGYCGRELYSLADRPNHLYMVGSMGCVVPLALGLALARPDLKVVALDGDGAALMRLGAFATVGAYHPSNLYHLLLDNGVHDSTGGQFTVAAQTRFAHIAAACGYGSSLETDDPVRLADWLQRLPQPGPHFARMLIRPGTAAELARPAIAPVDVKRRLMQHFAP